MTQDLELRVLTGLHQGAACAAQDGALLGSDSRCDVVLCDDGIAEEAGRLSVAGETWSISTRDGVEDVTDLPLGTAFQLGPIYLTLARAADPWPDPATLSAMLDRLPGPADDCTSDPTPDRLEAQAGAAYPAPSPRPRKSMGMRWAMGGLFVLLVFGSVASFSTAKVQPDPRAEMEPGLEAPALLRVQSLLREQGYADRIQASLDAEQAVTVTGWVRDQDEQDRLATALSSIWPLPSLRVDNQTLAAAILNARTQDLDVYVVPDYPAPGQLVIRGIAASEAVRSEAYKRWREDAGLSARATMRLLLAEEVANALDQAVAAAGLPRVASAWKDRALRIESRGLPSWQQDQLKTVLDKLNAHYMDALRTDRETGAIPFRVHTVVGGRQPWVVLEDGTRIVIGGTHGAYRLTSIEDGRVIFDGPTTAVIPR